MPVALRPVREVGEINEKSHYHMVLFVNKDTFNGLGSYGEGERD